MEIHIFYSRFDLLLEYLISSNHFDKNPHLYNVKDYLLKLSAFQLHFHNYLE